MKFHPTPKQTILHQAVESGKYSLILYGGAIRGGKTFVLIASIIMICRIFPGARYAIVRESLPSIKLNVLPVFKKLIPPQWTLQMPSASNNWTWIGTNGSQIIFFPENYNNDKDLERFKGLEVDGFGADELTELQKVTLDKTLERCGTWEMDKRQAAKREGKAIPPQIVIATCNPSQNWVKSEIYDKAMNGTLPERWLYISARVYDNPFVEQEWIDNLKIVLPPLTFDRFVEGDWEAVPNDAAWCYAYDEKKHVGGSNLLNNQLRIIVSFDFNVDPITCTVWQTDAKTFLHCVDELEVAKSQTNGMESTRALARKLKAKYPKSKYNYIITGDATGQYKTTSSRQTNYQIIADEIGLPIVKSIFNIRTKNLPLQMSETLVNSVLHCLPDFKISKDCPKLIKDFRMAKFDDKGGLLKDRNAYKMDYFDGARYAIDMVFPDFVENFKKYQSYWLQTQIA